MQTLAGRKRRFAILACIDEYQATHGGRSPSYQEIAAAVGLASTSSVGRYIRGLETLGFLLSHGRGRGRVLVRAGPKFAWYNERSRSA